MVCSLKGKLTTRNRNGEGHSCMNGEDTFMQSEWGEHAGDSYAGRKWIVVIFECKHKIVTWPLPHWLSCLQASLPLSREKTSTTNKRQKALPKSSSNSEAWILLIIVFRWCSFWKNQSYKMYWSSYVHFEVLRATNNTGKASVFFISNIQILKRGQGFIKCIFV